LSNDVSIIDLATFAVTNVSVGIFACDVMVSPNSQWAIVTNRLSGNVTIIDAVSKTAVATVATGTNPQGVVFMNYGHNGHVYVASNTQVGRVTVIDVGTNSVIGVFSVGVRPLGIGVRMWPTKM
jgi:YVTN family beta-propeller protein